MTTSANPSRDQLRAQRNRRAGQSMVEFALLAGLVFALLFGTIDGGLLMFQINAADHTANLGANVLAAEGSSANADSHAIAVMNRAGLGIGTTVTEYDVYLLSPDGSGIRDTNSCNGRPCMQQYAASGALVAGTWDPSRRNVSEGQSSFVELDVHYTWRYFFTPAATLHLLGKRVIRLEPQT